MLPLDSVLITGCSRGIGLEMVKQLSENPSPPKHIFATCRQPETAQELNNLSQQYPFIHVSKFDVTAYDSYESLVKEVDGVVGEKGLNLLINNAGIAGDCSLDETTASIMIDSYKTSTVAPLMMTKAFLPLLQRAQQCGDATPSRSSDGSICRAGVLAMSSKVASFEMFNSYRKTPYYPVRAAKAALNMTIRGLARDLDAEGILVVAMNPGSVITNCGGPNAPLSPQKSVEGMLETIGRMNMTHQGLHLSFNGEIIPW